MASGPDCLSHRTRGSRWSRRLRSVVIVRGPRPSRVVAEAFLAGLRLALRPQRGLDAVQLPIPPRGQFEGSATPGSSGLVSVSSVKGFQPATDQEERSGHLPESMRRLPMAAERYRLVPPGSLRASCPASAIRAFPPLLCPNRVSSSSAPMRRAATQRGRPESAWSPPHGSMTGWSSARVGA